MRIRSPAAISLLLAVPAGAGSLADVTSPTRPRSRGQSLF